MSICEYSVNIKNKCGNCKDFVLYNKNEIFGCCQSLHSRAKNKDSRSILSKCCISQRRIK